MFIKFSRRKLLFILPALAVLLAVWFISIYCIERGLTGRRQARFEETIPASIAGKVESVRLRTSDGQNLGAWYLEGRGDLPALVVAHGWGGCRSANLEYGLLFASEGYSVLLVTLRAHGDSSGEHVDFGYSARNDVVAAVEYLEQRRPARRIFIFGRSLGAAAVAFAAEALGNRAAGYVLESVYADLRTAVRNRTKAILPPLVEPLVYWTMILEAPAVDIDFDLTQPAKVLAQMPTDIPVLVLSGAKDLHTVPAEAAAVFDAVRSHGKLVSFPNAGHYDLLTSDPQRYRTILMDFLRKPAATCRANERNTYEDAISVQTGK